MARTAEWTRAFAAFLATLLLLVSAPGAAAAEADSPLAVRAAELPALSSGERDPETLFSPAFLFQVPATQVKSVTRQLRASHGRAKAVQRIAAKGPTAGTVFVEFEQATVIFEMAVSPAPPHFVEGLLVAGAERGGDTVAAVFGEMVALPGQVSIAAARLEPSGPTYFLTEKADRALAVGSAFKVFVLAELVRAVRAGERGWSDVVRLGAASLPSGILQDWPKSSPLTLHSLAALMISRSDNTATDTLLHLLGREKVEAAMGAAGVADPARNRPFLSTREAFALKLGDPALLAEWTRGNEAARRALLRRIGSGDVAKLDPSRLGGSPTAIESVEWFASPADLVRTLDWIRRSGDSTALDLLAINPGLGSALAGDFSYMGFKGGSEPGVMSLNALLRRKEGQWIALSVAWNDPSKPLDESKLVGLVQRLIVLLR
jgi:beta-lactamase class A